MKKLNCVLLSIVYILGTCSFTSCGKLTYEESQNKLKSNFKVEDYLYLKTFDNSDVFEKFPLVYIPDCIYDTSNTYLKVTSTPELVDYFRYDPYYNDNLNYFSSDGKEYFINNNYNYYNYWSFKNKRILIYPNKIDNDLYSFCFTDSHIESFGQYIENWSSFIESNGVYGFVLTFCTQDFLDYTLSMLYNTNDFDYDIYFVKYEGNQYNFFCDIYLIPKDENFSKDIVIKFAELGNYAYFDMDAVRTYQK
jgi:hypothetical protein